MCEKLMPSVLFASTNDKPEDIIELVIGTLPLAKEEDGVEYYPWHVDTKYYEADVRLCVVKEKSLLNQTFAASVHGVVIIFDGESSYALDDVESWYNYLKEYEADVKILLCKQCREDSPVGRIRVQEWCVKNGFELVELEPILDDEWEEEQDFIETTGIKRVVQALHAHVWPNLVVKDRKDPTSMSALLNGGKCKSTNSHHLDPDNLEPSTEDLLDFGEFSDLFGQMATLKERADTLSRDERKDYAEQIVTAFWNAIGGDENEDM